ncbi:MAG: aspartate kinase, partial [Nitrososphaerota archaeon]|jgi:aspartate kinase|nr:aspartate kinase [Nitrososphaerota archaeon]MDG6944610.1 aspartate kinase [Nitrososphaerota archaeon]
MKFSSSALKNGGYIKAAEIMGERSKHGKAVGIISSVKGSVDLLNEASNLAAAGKLEDSASRVSELYGLYLEEVNKNGYGGGNKLAELRDELLNLLRTISVLGEITPSIKDRVISYAESFSIETFKTAAGSIGIAVDARSGGDWGIITDDEYGSASPLYNSSYQAIKNAVNHAGENRVLVVGGLTGKTRDGRVTYMGKGSSDMVAATFAVTLNADTLEVWSNVDGLMTADPRFISNAKPISRLSYNEARELLSFNSELFSPVSLDLLSKQGIKINIKNVNNRDLPGTLIARDSQISPNVAKAVAYIDQISIITLEGVNIQKLVPRILARMIEHGIEIRMMSLSASATELSIIVPACALNRCKSIIEFEFLGKDINDYHAVNSACAISIVGEGMKGTPGVAAKLFNSVARNSINVLMITQGSSELNIGFVVESSSCIKALKSVHSEFIESS